MSLLALYHTADSSLTFKKTQTEQDSVQSGSAYLERSWPDQPCFQI